MPAVPGIRDYRGSRRISAPSLFLTEMTGSETVVTGPEAPGDGGPPAAAAAFTDDDIAQIGYDDFAHDTAAPRQALRPRDDGLVVEFDAGETAAAPPPRGGPRLPSALQPSWPPHWLAAVRRPPLRRRPARTTCRLRHRHTRRHQRHGPPIGGHRDLRRPCRHAKIHPRPRRPRTGVTPPPNRQSSDRSPDHRRGR